MNKLTVFRLDAETMLDAFDDQEEIEFEDDFDDGQNRTFKTTTQRIIVPVFQYSNILLEFQLYNYN